MSHKYRLYPTPGQESVLMRHCSDSRTIWNVALEQFNGSRRVDIKTWDKQLSEARAEFDWLRDGSSSVQQAALRDLRQALKNWWSNPAHFRRPTWRSYRKGSMGFVVRDLTATRLSRKWGEITIPKAGRVRFRWTRALPNDAKSARVTQDRAGRWYVSVVSGQPEFPREQTGAVVGLDFGVTHTATTSQGDHLDMPELLTHGEDHRLRRLQRRMARQQKGSNRRQRTKIAIARLKARERDRRKDWIEQTSTTLVRDYDHISIEDLQVKNLLRSASGTIEEPGKNVAQKRGLNRGIHSAAWSVLRTRIEQKASAATSHVLVMAVNPAYTSQRCAACGHTEGANRESQAVFSCRSCGHTANADVNAARNINAAGLAVSGRGGAPHQRPDEASTSDAA
jgi:putative transposase